jgi:hypothetical protein
MSLFQCSLFKKNPAEELSPVFLMLHSKEHHLNLKKKWNHAAFYKPKKMVFESHNFSTEEVKCALFHPFHFLSLSSNTGVKFIPLEALV